MHYPEFGDFCDVAASVLGITAEQVSRLPNVGLAQSALAAPRAGFGDVELYPTLLEKAAVLLERLARNHPLPDGNKRTAFIVTGLFLEANGRPFQGANPNVDVPLVERVAAGEASRAGIVAWLGTRTDTTPTR
ncbi:MAG: type II toxin-antitoxin system death-on-curing family toxin [Solirubrobacteraceae bacterium]|jgi:death-on-curing protein